MLANFLILSDTLLATLRREIDEIWVLPRNSTIWRHNDVKLRRCDNHFIPWCWKWWVYTIQSNFGGRAMSGRRQQNKKARSECRVKLTSAKKFSMVYTPINHRNDVKMFKSQSGTTIRSWEVSLQSRLPKNLPLFAQNGV